jgi:vitamin B12 transporter
LFTSNYIQAIVGAGNYKETMNAKSFLYSWSFYGLYTTNTDLDTLHIQSTTSSVFFHTDLNGKLIDDDFKDISLGIGGRINMHNAYGRNGVMELNPTYSITQNSVLYASFTTGFYAPSLYQLYAPDKYYTSMITRGNKNLQPEKSVSVEFGYKMQFEEFLKFSIALFSTRVENYIEYVYLWDKNIGLDTLGNNWMRDDYRGDTYLNLGTMRTSGIEMLLHSELSESFRCGLNVTLLKGSLEYNPSTINASHTEGNHVQIFSNGRFLNTNISSVALTRRPSTANMYISYSPIYQLLLRLDIKIVGKRNDAYYDSNLGPYGALGSVSIDSYTLFDFSQRLIVNENIAIHGRIENLFNKKYSEIRGFTTRGRGAYIGLNISL